VTGAMGVFEQETVPHVRPKGGCCGGKGSERERWRLRAERGEAM